MGLLDCRQSTFAAVLLLLLLVKSSSQISNGAPAAAGEFPFVVQLLIAVSSNGTHSMYANCGGSILSPNVVLTAAHCVHSHSHKPAHGHAGAREIQVIAGELWRQRRPNTPESSENGHDVAAGVSGNRRHSQPRSRNQSQTATVRRIVIHEQYRQVVGQEGINDRSMSLSPYDVALLHLDHRLHFNEFIQPVQLAKCSGSDDDGNNGQGHRHDCTWNHANSNLQACGWGFETEDHQPFLLRKAHLAYDPDQTQCFERLHRRARMRVGSKPQVAKPDLSDLTKKSTTRRVRGEHEEHEISTSTLCVGDTDGSNVCKGDSGGPLICTVNGTKYVCGVASWALRGQCGVVGAPAVFTDVTRFREWILDEIRPGRATKDISSSSSNETKSLAKSQAHAFGHRGSGRASADSSKPVVFVIAISVCVFSFPMKLLR